MNHKSETNIENTKAQMRRGILEFCILLVISAGEAYVADILTTLKKADLIVVEGTIYPLLTRMKNAGLVEYAWQESKSGPPRKYYSLTKEGTAFLQELKTTWRALDESINVLVEKFKK
jgi:PadR family transcriptional regulator PadR